MPTLNLKAATAATQASPAPAPRVKTAELFAECLVCGGESDEALCAECSADLDKAAKRVRVAREATEEWVRVAHEGFIVPPSLTTWWAKVEMARAESDPRFAAAWSAALAGGGERARLCRAWIALDRRCGELAVTQARLNKAQRAINTAWLDQPLSEAA